MTPDPADLARFNAGVARARAEYNRLDIKQQTISSWVHKAKKEGQ